MNWIIIIAWISVCLAVCSGTQQYNQMDELATMGEEDGIDTVNDVPFIELPRNLIDQSSESEQRQQQQLEHQSEVSTTMSNQRNELDESISQEQLLYASSTPEPLQGVVNKVQRVKVRRKKWRRKSTTHSPLFSNHPNMGERDGVEVGQQQQEPHQQALANSANTNVAEDESNGSVRMDLSKRKRRKMRKGKRLRVNNINSNINREDAAADGQDELIAQQQYKLQQQNVKRLMKIAEMEKKKEQQRQKQEAKRLRQEERERKRQALAERRRSRELKQKERLLRRNKPKQKKKQKQQFEAPLTPPENISVHIVSLTNSIDDAANEVNFVDDTNTTGDLSCLKNGFKPAPRVLHADIKYIRNDLLGFDNAFVEVEYFCHPGYTMVSNQSRNVFCRNNRWIGETPNCEMRDDGNELSGILCPMPNKCHQMCRIDDSKGEEVCSCYKGFRMQGDRCEDINECTEKAHLCKFGCSNTIGSYKCKCPRGLRSGDTFNCIDVNECLLRNGHGPCQDSCTNTWGGYKCSCDKLPGTRLTVDEHSCEDVDECSINNGGCTHTCVNTMGRAFCLCPNGWSLSSDWRTCVDLDECADPDISQCEYGCINTPGSFKCIADIGADEPVREDFTLECPTGYTFNRTTEDCQDEDECDTNNGGCSDKCTNTIGGYHCSCRSGYVFGQDKATCVASNSSADVACPPLFPPKHGYLECSRPTSNVAGRRRITNRPGSQCILRCPTGFKVTGRFAKICGDAGEWVGDGDGYCIRYPTPRIVCPPNLVVETPPKEQMAKVRIPRPKTEVRWDQDVSVTPMWARNAEQIMEVGISNLTFIAKHPISKLTAECSFTITVLEGKPPHVKFCPDIQKYTLSKQHESLQVSWPEPVFIDNVNVTEISQTNTPGNSFGYGSHQIIYEAKDQAGFAARCIFKILVNAPPSHNLNHPLPIYKLFYK